jgi:hypothetical protein
MPQSDERHTSEHEGEEESETSGVDSQCDASDTQHMMRQTPDSPEHSDAAAAPAAPAGAASSAVGPTVRPLVLTLSVHYALVSSLQSGLFPVTLPAVQRDFEVSHTDMAWLVAMYDITQIAGGLAASVLSRFVRPAVVVAMGGGCSLAGALLFAWITPSSVGGGGGFSLFYAAQGLMGLGAACVNVLCPNIVTCAVGGDTSRGSFLR